MRLTIVKPIGFRIDVIAKVERLDRNMRPFDARLEQRPEIFQPVSVDRAFDIGFGMVNEVVEVSRAEGAVGLESIAVDGRSLRNVFADHRADVFKL